MFGKDKAEVKDNLNFAQGHLFIFDATEKGSIGGKKEKEAVLLPWEGGINEAQIPEVLAKEGYIFTHWTADEDVKMGEKTIKKGERISQDDVKKITVDTETKAQIIFTANYKEKTHPKETRIQIRFHVEEDGVFDHHVEKMYTRSLKPGDRVGYPPSVKANKGKEFLGWTLKKDYDDQTGLLGKRSHIRAKKYSKGVVMTESEVEKIKVVNRDLDLYAVYQDKKEEKKPNKISDKEIQKIIEHVHVKVEKPKHLPKAGV